MLKKTLRIFFVALLFSACGATDAGHVARSTVPALNADNPARQQSAPFVSDEVLVCFSPQTDMAFVKKTAARYKLTITKAFNTPGLFLMHITDASPVEIMIKRLKKVAAITCAEPNYHRFSQ